MSRFHPFLSLLLLLAGTFTAMTSSSAADKPEAAKTTYLYTLTVTDQIRVVIFQEDDLTKISRVDAGGNVNLPLVGDVHVAGLTVNEAQSVIAAAYRDGLFLRKPQVTISIETYATREVSIQGQVKAAGRYILPAESTFTVVDLVTKAGGFTDIAKGTEVTITHFTGDGKKEIRVVDVESIIRGKKKAKSDDATLMLQANDIVNVPERII